MKRISSLLFVVAIALAGCTLTTPDGEVIIDGKATRYTASFESAPTRTYVDGNFRMFWTADDRLSIFTTTYNQQYVFIGKTGDNSGEFAKVSSGGFVSGGALSTNYAVYPYNSTTSISYDGEITLTLPAVQKYGEGTFGPGANTMVAVTEDSDDTFLSFKNICGYLVVRFYGDATIKSVTLTGNDNERIAGKATVTQAFNSNPETTIADDATTTITIDCGEGVKLGSTADAATEFWFCVPPTTFNKGFTISAEDINGGTYSKSTTASRTITRNIVNAMSALKYAPDVPYEMVDLGLSVKWASCNIGASKPEDVGGRFAWGEVEAKTIFDWTNYTLCDGSIYSMKKYCTSSSYGKVDGKTKLDDEDDAAKVILGGLWRMPTKAELDELAEKCVWKAAVINNVNGYRVTGPSGNSIFLPCNGQYDESGLHWKDERAIIWSSENDGTGYAYSLGATGSSVATDCNHHRHDGECIRAVYGDSSSLSVPEMVDLGLSVKWASCNLDANLPEQYGAYYQWAGLQDVTSTSIDLGWSNCPYHTGSDYNTGWTKYIQSAKSSYWSGSGSPDNKTVLDPEDDVAHVILGGAWRMPTDAEWAELKNIDNCTWTWTTRLGVNGYKVTSKKTGNIIFLPAAGYRDGTSLYSAGYYGNYWSSSLFTVYPSGAYYLCFDSDYVYMYYSLRYYGLSVRPVYGDAAVAVTGVSLSKTSMTITEGDTQTLTATIIPSNATNKNVTWSSSNASVATVDANGKVTAVKAGTATITVKTSDGSKTATCQVTVTSSSLEYVDLGLSVKWATCNVGATKQEQYGGYYQWAGLQDVTSTSINLSYSNCPYHTGSDANIGWTKYIPSRKSSFWYGSGSPDNKTVLDPEDDVAHVKLGGKWRMPTNAEWTELRNNCTWAWTTLNGVEGCLVTSKTTGNSIFLPAAGYCDGTGLNGAGFDCDYWSSSLYTGLPGDARGVHFSSDSVYRDYGYRRYNGRSVRPVSE